MMRSRLTLLTAALCIGLGGLVLVPSAGATTHPAYPLGKAKSCKAHYVKRTERHKVGGKEVRYVACVYVAPPVTTTTTTTTTTTLPSGPTAQLIENILDARLLGDGIAIAFNGLPAIPQVDALPGDTVYLEAFVNEPTTTGSVSFSINGTTVPSCANVGVFLNATATQSEAQCQYQFDSGGTVTVGETFLGSDRSHATAQRTFTVASADEVSIILDECAMLTLGKCP